MSGDLFEGEGLTFAQAVGYAMVGERVTRRGWNGKGMYVGWVGARRVKADAETSAFLGVPCGHAVSLAGYFRLRAADGTLVVSWLASQTDMGSNDWEVV